MNCRLRTNERDQTMEWDCNRMHAYISDRHPKALYTLMEYSIIDLLMNIRKGIG